MTGKERVQAVLAGKAPDRLPMGFWYHFPEESFASVEDTVRYHKAFYDETQVDLFKIMNENIFPYEVEISEAADFRKLEPVTADAPWIRKQVETTRRIIEALDGEPYILMTLHGTIASAWHARGGSAGYSEGSLLLQRYLREDPEAMAHLFGIIADAMCLLIDQVKDSGVDAIYYSALGGESYLFTDEEYERHVKPYDAQIFKHAQSVFPDSILHVCKDELHLERFAPLLAKVVNWGEHQNNPALEMGREVFPGAVLLGGFDNAGGVLFDGTKEEVSEHISQVIERLGEKGLIIGADCTLPGDIDLGRIRLVREVLEERKNA